MDKSIKGQYQAGFRVLPDSNHFHQGKWNPRWKRCLPVWSQTRREPGSLGLDLSIPETHLFPKQTMQTLSVV